MSDERKDWKRLVFGWAIDFQKTEAGGEAAAPSSDEPDAQTLPTIDANKVSAPRDGAIDFGEVFTLADLSSDEVEHVRKAQDLLRNLPGDAPLPVKRQIVEASLKAFGFDPRHLIEASVREIKALEAYIRAGAELAHRHNGATEAMIRDLTAQIAALRKQVETESAQQAERARGCTAKKLEVQQVLEFFGPEEVGRVVKGDAAAKP